MRELKGCQRIHLESGESRAISFELAAALALYDGSMRVTEPGVFHAWIGGSSMADPRVAFDLVAD